MGTYTVDYAKSASSTVRQKLDAIYKKAFPQHRSHCVQDADRQKAGIDISLNDAGFTEIKIEEKIRPARKDGKIFNDVLLETVSNCTTNSNGWAVDMSKTTDWLIYHIESIDITLLIDYKALRNYAIQIPLSGTWSSDRIHYGETRDEYGVLLYESQNYAVTIEELLRASVTVELWSDRFERFIKGIDRERE